MTAHVLYCAFCGKSQHEVRKLIAGPTVNICDECVELCVTIVRDEVIAPPEQVAATIGWSGPLPLARGHYA